jgi:acetylornithine deacetylase
VVGVLRGQGEGPSLLLNGHMDTVGVLGMDDPFGATIRDGRLYGRGSQDMKGSLSAMLAAAKAIQEAGLALAGDLLVTAVADEEYASIGMEDLVRNVRADAAIVTEPTDLALCRAHRGFAWYQFETTGRAAHGSRYMEGVDAIMHMGRILAELDRLEQDLRMRKPHELAGPPSLHASLIGGGTELSVYPASSWLKIERRTIPGETIPAVTAELEAIVQRLDEADATFDARLSLIFERSPFAVAADAPIVKALEGVATQRLGRAPAHMGATFWTDAALLAEAGIDSVLMGPAGAGLHSAVEWVDLASVVDLATILAGTALRFCGKAA